MAAENREKVYLEAHSLQQLKTHFCNLQTKDIPSQACRVILICMRGIQNSDRPWLLKDDTSLIPLPTLNCV